MSFVELNRCFVPIGKDQEPSFDIGRQWGRKIGGWLDWADLLQHWRVVLLAEASSGKSVEFRNQADRLISESKAAYFVPIEELADQGFEAALEPRVAGVFQQWRKGTGEGWFFLDAEDEARLNRKSFGSALKRFASDLGASIERARVFISCRVSDWEGPKNCDLIERIIPAWVQPKTEESGETANTLLDPIFKKKNQVQIRLSEPPERKPNELLVVQLSPLSVEQYRTFAKELGVNDVDAFVTAIHQNGLDAFTERPGDLIDLIDYWNTYGRFGSFAEMVEHSINRKLKELNLYRPDNEVLSLQKARQGAERLAAAMTLGKSFTIRSPGYEPDPTLASGAIDPALILEEWTVAERNALLRRGVFAPSTYGRIRFHHRSTQEYLTAQWFDRILRSNSPRTEIWDLIFASRYGVETVVPSLRPAAAWLALGHPDFLDEIIRREPLILLRHGDSGSLPLEARRRLLAKYATKHATAEIADDSIDQRAIWMFAHPDLAGAIREAWNVNSRPDFRLDLLRIVRDGAIVDCADLARNIALDDTAEDYPRIVAIEALDSCKDSEGLALVVDRVDAALERLSARFASSYARALFPSYLTVEQLFLLIEKSQPARESAAGSFPYIIKELYDACPDCRVRKEFVTRLTDLCLKQPFVEDYQRVSMRYFDLAKHTEAIAKREIQVLENGEPPDYLVRLLMVVERAEREYNSGDEGLTLSQLVQNRTKLQRRLFWSDVEEQRTNSKDPEQPNRFGLIQNFGEPLWKLGNADLSWLYEDLSQSTVEANQRIALGAIVTILYQTGKLETKANCLRKLVKNSSVLKEELEAYLSPPPENDDHQNHKRRMEERRRERTEKEEKDKASWVDFGRRLRENPNLIRDPRYLRSWTSGAYRLWDLTRWLRHRTEAREEAASRQWRLLEEAFGRQVAEAYRDGMKVLWRLTKPERPKRDQKGTITFKYLNMLAFSAVGIEAAEDSDWASKLSNDEAKKAVMHGCYTEHGYPEWIQAVLLSHPQVVLPILKTWIKQEWLAPSPGLSDFLYHLARPAFPIPPAFQQILFKTIAGQESGDLGKLDTGLCIIKKLNLDRGQICKLKRVSRRRFSKHAGSGKSDFALRYLAILLFLDPDYAADDLTVWLESCRDTERQIHAERTFKFLFDRHDSVLSSALSRATVPTLEKLFRLAYFYIRPEHDAVHEGGYTPELRDDAQSARNVILSAILDLAGEEAYRALRRVADDPEYALRAERFRQLARGKAERDSELIAWTAKDIINFEQQHTAPVKTGVDLLRVVMAVLDDIQFQLDNGDVSSRPLLQRAKDEDEVQNWIVEQMNYRSRGRYHAHREAQVAGGNKPDVIVSSTAASCEVAIEIKHGGKEWTARKLERALRKQLVQDYLKPPMRRHGILVVTHHGMRHWRNPNTNRTLPFDALIRWLGEIATTLIENDTGPIEVKCFGIDTSPLKICPIWNQGR